MKNDELNYYYALYKVMNGIRLDADESDDEENAEQEKRGGAGTHLPYGLAKGEGIDIPEGTTPSGAWKILEGKMGIKAEDVFSKIKEKGSPKEAFNEAKAEGQAKKAMSESEIKEIEAEGGSVVPEGMTEAEEKELTEGVEPVAESEGAEHVESTPNDVEGETKSEPVDGGMENAEGAIGNKTDHVSNIKNIKDNGDITNMDKKNQIAAELDALAIGSELSFKDSDGNETILTKGPVGWDNGKGTYDMPSGPVAIKLISKAESFSIDEPNNTQVNNVPVGKLSKNELKSGLHDILEKETHSYDDLPDIANVMSGAENGTKIKLKDKWYGKGSDEFEGGTFTKNGDNEWVSSSTGEILTDEQVAEGAYFNKFYSGSEPKFVSSIESKVENPIQKINDVLKQLKDDPDVDTGEIANVVNSLPVGTVFINESAKFVKTKEGWVNKQYGGLVSAEEISTVMPKNVSAGKTLAFGDEAPALDMKEKLDSYSDLKEDYSAINKISNEFLNVGYLESVECGEDKFLNVGSGKFLDVKTGEKYGAWDLSHKLMKENGFAVFESSDANPIKGVSGKVYSNYPLTNEEIGDALEGFMNGDVPSYKIHDSIPAGKSFQIGNNKFISLGKQAYVSQCGTVKSFYQMALEAKNNGANIIVGDEDLPELEGSQTYGFADGEIKAISSKPETQEEILEAVQNISKIGVQSFDYKSNFDFSEIPEGTKITIKSNFKEDNGTFTKQEDGSWKKGSSKKNQDDYNLKNHILYGNDFEVTMPKTAAEGGKHTMSWLQLKTKELEKKIAKTGDIAEKESLQKELEGYQAELAPKLEKAEAKKKEKAKQAKLVSLNEQKDSIQNQYDEYKAGYDAAKGKQYEGIWKEPVTLADYEDKKDSIQSKKEYFDNKIKQYHSQYLKADYGSEEEKEAIQNKQKFQALKDSLTEYEDAAKKYSEGTYKKQCENYEKKLSQKNAQIEDVNNGGIGLLPVDYSSNFTDDDYSQDRKDNASWYKTAEEANEHYKQLTEEVWPDLSYDEKKAIYRYTGSYSDINESLRGQEYGNQYNHIGVENVDWNGKMKYVTSIIDDMTSGIAKSVTQDDRWLQRGSAEWTFAQMFRREDGSVPDISEIEVGDVGTENAFVSCTSKKGGAGGFNNDIVWNVYCPKGTQLMYVDPFSQYSSFGSHQGADWDGHSYGVGSSDELETLLQRGTSFRVMKKEHKNGKWYIDVDVVAQNPGTFW